MSTKFVFVIRKVTLVFLQEDDISAELGLAASEDAIIDSLSEKAEKEIVFGNSGGKNLIGHCAPFLCKLCRNFSLMHKVNVSYPFYIYTLNEYFYSLTWWMSGSSIHHIMPCGNVHLLLFGCDFCQVKF